MESKDNQDKDKKNHYMFHDKQVIVITDGDIAKTNEDIADSHIFEETLRLYLDFLRKKDSPLLDIMPKATRQKDKISQDKEILKMLKLLVNTSKEKIKKIYPEYDGYFSDIYLFNQFVEELYNFWRHYERYLILLSEDVDEKEFHKRPYRSFNESIEELNHLVRSTYREICENITNDHPRVFRQIPAGFQSGIIASRSRASLPEDYKRLKDIAMIRQIFIEPPLIINPPMNKRSGFFREVKVNPYQNIEIEPKEWLCFPAMVGDLIIHIFFHHRFMSLGTSLANLFELVDETRISEKPDAIYLYGVEEEQLKSYDEPRTIYYKDEENDIYTGFVPGGDKFGYFGYLKKMVLTLHNIVCMERGKMPLHGTLAKVCLKDGKEKNIILIGDSGAGKSESLEAFRLLSDEYLRQMTIVFDDMGSLELSDKTDGKVKAYGTETGAFVRLDDLQPGFVYGNMDRSIIMSPEKINARAVLPITTIKEVLEGHDVDMILYANNYDEPDGDNHIDFFSDWKEAFDVFKEGKRMAKGTTTETGLTTSYFANPFGPHQKKDMHEKIAERFFKAFFDTGIKVGEIKTMLGIEGFEKKGPELATKSLFRVISEME